MKYGFLKSGKNMSYIFSIMNGKKFPSRCRDFPVKKHIFFHRESAFACGKMIRCGERDW